MEYTTQSRYLRIKYTTTRGKCGGSSALKHIRNYIFQVFPFVIGNFIFTLGG